MVLQEWSSKGGSSTCNLQLPTVSDRDVRVVSKCRKMKMTLGPKAERVVESGRHGTEALKVIFAA